MNSGSATRMKRPFWNVLYGTRRDVLRPKRRTILSLTCERQERARVVIPAKHPKPAILTIESLASRLTPSDSYVRQPSDVKYLAASWAASTTRRVVAWNMTENPLTTGAIMAKEIKTLDVLFHDTLKDVYFAENKIVDTLPKMRDAAKSKQLKDAFIKHLGETKVHVERLDQVFKIIGKKPEKKTCDAIMGITQEGASIMDEYEGSPALDAGLLAAAQAVEHYEMSRYGTLRTWALELGMKDAAKLLQTTLDEEQATDIALTAIATKVVNQTAEKAA